MMPWRRVLRVSPLFPALAACSVAASHVADRAQHDLLGMSGEDVEMCLGLPDQRHSPAPETQILTYNVTSASNGGVSLTVPLIGGISISGGGYCHVTVKLQNNAVTEIRYSGAKDEFAAPDAYCAPAVRACVNQPEHNAPVDTPFYERQHLTKLEKQEGAPQ